MLMKQVFALTTALYASSLALAQTPASQAIMASEQLTPHWEKIPTSPEVIAEIESSLTSNHSSNVNPLSGDIDWSVIANLGKTIWTVINNNAPVATLQYDYATGLPKGVASAAELDNFSDLNFETYRFYFTNGLGSTVIDVEYTLVHQFGGSYEGRGKYLATVAIVPTKVEVSWGHKINMKAATISSLNVGTAEDPVASVTLEMSYEVRTVFQTFATRKLYQFRGDSAEIIATKL